MYIIYIITTNGNNRNVRIVVREHNKVRIIPETQLSQNDRGEDGEVLKRTIFCFMARVYNTEMTSKLIPSSKIIYLFSF